MTAVRNLKEHELRTLSKIVRKARALAQSDPRLTRAEVFALAVQSLPKTYAAYESTRAQLAALGIRPMLVEEVE